MTDTEEVRQLLLGIEAELRRIGLWSSVPPADEALSSKAPFCFDTLALHEWLQWILLPRVRVILDGGLALPDHSGIAALGEQMFPQLEQDTRELLALLKRFDTLIEGPGAAP